MSIVIPCLNEEETIGICIKKCFDVFSKLGITGEVIVVDNNSTDSSAKLALESGAKVCSNNIKGYGISLIKGFECASGEYILFADGDDSYDFLEVEKFWKNRNMGDMILGSRFKGTICKGAMPALHRYFGTPFLTLCLNILYGCKISDSQSGMRMCKKKDIDNINLESTGMEFASEILIKYAINKLTIYEIPVTLHKDGRTNHKPHLRPFRDGFRHLFYMIKKRF
ncbi:MAG: glycosyltransferase family 2 protein [Candidatus Gastranaerophilales bacterium]|nr:glycosyltransferase family 2 protein [Candidatus Gastranaerophilales bacterium]